MVDVNCSLIFYKIPSTDILQRRKVFYGLQKENYEPAGKWLNRVQKHIQHCEFSGFAEYLLIDKFISELNNIEMAGIQSDDSWSLKQLTEYFFDGSRSMAVKPELDDRNEILVNVDENTLIEQLAHVIKEEDPLGESTTSYEIPTGGMASEIEDNEYSVNDLLELELNDNDESFDKIPNVQRNQQKRGQPKIHFLPVDADAWECCVCRIICTTHKNLQTHMYDCHTQTDHREDVTDQYGSVSYTCELCNKKFGKSRYLKRHLITHTRGKHNAAEKVYTCNICDSAFTQLATMKRHTLRIHDNIRPFECKDCGKRFFSSDELRNHSLIHSGIKVYACNVCNKSFAQLSNMNTHIRVVHEKLRPHKCEGCAKTFATAHDVRRHSIIHKDNEKKPFACDICEKSFNVSYDLTRHKRTCHDNSKAAFNCPECDKTFASAKTLKHHSIVHTGETPYTCNVCSKNFSNMGNLNMHKNLVHENRRLFPCKSCGKVFGRNSELQCHSIKCNCERETCERVTK